MSGTDHASNAKNTILLAACGNNELLPQNPELPADLFTSCLTTPIRMALRWYVAAYYLKHIYKFSLQITFSVQWNLLNSLPVYPSKIICPWISTHELMSTYRHFMQWKRNHGCILEDLKC